MFLELFAPFFYIYCHTLSIIKTLKKKKKPPKYYIKHTSLISGYIPFTVCMFIKCFVFLSCCACLRVCARNKFLKMTVTLKTNSQYIILIHVLRKNVCCSTGEHRKQLSYSWGEPLGIIFQIFSSTEWHREVKTMYCITYRWTT